LAYVQTFLQVNRYVKQMSLAPSLHRSLKPPVGPRTMPCWSQSWETQTPLLLWARPNSHSSCRHRGML